jgi:hypothetical protein
MFLPSLSVFFTPLLVSRSPPISVSMPGKLLTATYSKNYGYFGNIAVVKCGFCEGFLCKKPYF